MALKIIDALKSDFPHDGSFGRAHLIFDSEIEANPLRLSLKRLDDQEYLGESFPPTASEPLPKANWTRIRSHFFDASLVTRGNGQTVYMLGPEVSTFVPEWTLLEVASDDGSVRETAEWGEISLDFIWRPPAQPLPAWKSSVPLGAPVGQPTRQGQAASPPAPAVAPDPPKPEPPKTEPSKVESPGATPTASIPPKVDHMPPAIKAAADDPPGPPAPPRKRANWVVWAGLLAAVAAVVVAGAVYAAYWGSQNRDKLCNRFHIFCDAEETAFRDAQSCASSKTCSASECVAHYRDAYPNGRFKAQIDDIAVSKGRPCVVEPPRPDPEKLAFDRVTACAAPKSCGAAVCVAEYRQSFPNGAHKADVDRIMAQKGADCVDAAEKEVYDQAVGCARPRSCGALECLGEYRRRYPNGRYKAQIDQIAQAKGQVCPDLDREAYDRAERCAAPLPCGADHCLTEYRRDFSAGKNRARIEEIGKAKGAACAVADTLPPFVPIRPGDESGVRNCNARNLEPIVQMICKDSDMARANGELQKAFDAKVKSLGDASELRNGERAWIERRDRECNVPASGNWETNDLRRLKNCFLDKTRARINELRQ
jgi:uncharacterized protein YecT (DUF1311 family)